MGDTESRTREAGRVTLTKQITVTNWGNKGRDLNTLILRIHKGQE